MVQAVRNLTLGRADHPPATSTGLKLRHLPDGDFQEGSKPFWSGRFLKIDVEDQGFSVGTLLEIECGSMMYLGEVQQRTESTHVILVEHSLDRSKLDFVEESWG